ncbi:hypothetical protein [Caldimonas brevitalea]|uniref:Uncharacterized protein n=1 Tax=Caldimonas brevitalea TaxID=413882 RepID=A0A0G3BUG4_9BURK|nr:hypothetical protein [Caldimonas brevitalea]AKJ30175.1 hypothetical protein AAW51_3484 [Caldimonas brevitalea]
MNTLVLLLEQGSEWNPNIWAAENGGETGANGQIMIERSEGWLSVLRDDSVLNDFDEDERRRLSELLTEPAGYLIEWRDSALVEALLQAVPPQTRAVIDNDHGLLVPVQAVRERPFESWVRASMLR